MDTAAVLYYLNDLPPTFKRRGAGFAQMMASLGTGVSLGTEASDAVLAQIAFDQAQWGWLDFWGQLFGIPRLFQEEDAVYRQRIQTLLLLRGATPVALETFINAVYAVNCTIKEDFTDTAWFLNLSSTIAGVNYDTLASALGTVRPAGVPYTPFQIAVGGCFISSVNFLGGARVPGSWINSSTIAQNFSLSAGTTNSAPLLPSAYLSDPMLNPSLAVTPTPAPIAALSTPNRAPPGQLVLGSDAYTNFTIVQTSPNGTLGGGLNDKAFNMGDRVLYICTTAGDASTALWTPANEVIGEVP